VAGDRRDGVALGGLEVREAQRELAPGRTEVDGPVAGVLEEAAISSRAALTSGVFGGCALKSL
jgi:hypothetical protein